MPSQEKNNLLFLLSFCRNLSGVSSPSLWFKEEISALWFRTETKRWQLPLKFKAVVSGALPRLFCRSSVSLLLSRFGLLRLSCRQQSGVKLQNILERPERGDSGADVGWCVYWHWLWVSSHTEEGRHLNASQPPTPVVPVNHRRRNWLILHDWTEGSADDVLMCKSNVSPCDY